jgi:hypothetical protein
MTRRRDRTGGLTIIELLMSMLMASIIMAGVAAVMYGSHRDYSLTYRRATSDIVSDAYAARRAFDAAVRRSTWRQAFIGASGESLEVYFYGDQLSTALDRYARFYRSGEELLVDYGPLEPGTFTALAPTATQTLARHVTECRFSGAGVSLSLHLVLDNEKEQLAVATTAVPHNA